MLVFLNIQCLSNIHTTFDWRNFGFIFLLPCSFWIHFTHNFDWRSYGFIFLFPCSFWIHFTHIFSPSRHWRALFKGEISEFGFCFWPPFSDVSFAFTSYPSLPKLLPSHNEQIIFKKHYFDCVTAHFFKKKILLCYNAGRKQVLWFIVAFFMQLLICKCLPPLFSLLFILCTGLFSLSFPFLPLINSCPLSVLLPRAVLFLHHHCPALPNLSLYVLVTVQSWKHFIITEAKHMQYFHLAFLFISKWS